MGPFSHNTPRHNIASDLPDPAPGSDTSLHLFPLQILHPELGASGRFCTPALIPQFSTQLHSLLHGGQFFPGAGWQHTGLLFQRSEAQQEAAARSPSQDITVCWGAGGCPGDSHCIQDSAR